MTQQCDTYWWTNAVWISNLYPAGFDEKCLPWTWFVPCYVQLTLLLPIILAIYSKIDSPTKSLVVFGSIGAASLIWNFFIVYNKNIGGTMVLNDQFFSEVFMTPWYQFSSFYFGIMMSLVYFRFKEDRQDQPPDASFSSRFLEVICNNSVPRYFMYMLGLFSMVAAIFWQMPFVGRPQEMSQLENALFATFAMPLYLVGLCTILMPALGGKAEVFRFFYGS